MESLETNGWNKIESRSSKYIVYTKQLGNPVYLFVGKSGALRIASTNCSTKTVPVSDRLKKQILGV